MSFLICGDPHLGKGTSLGKTAIGTSLNSRIQDQINLLDWCLEQAASKNITDIVLTGDIFDDPKPPTSLIAIFISWLKKCQLHNINAHIIVGNHDILRSGSAYNSPLDVVEECGLDGVYVYRNINTVILDGFAITFTPFKDRKSLGADSNQQALGQLKNQLVYELAGIPSTYKKIIIGHLAIAGSIYVGDEIDDLANELMCPLDLFEGYDYVWMGHIHKPQVMNNSPHIAHIGSMDISDFGETDHQKKIVIFDPSLEEEYQYHTLPTRKLNKIVITVPDDVEDVNSFVTSEIDSKNLNLKNSIVKLEINLEDKNKVINKSELEKFLSKRGTFNISSIVESKKQISLKKEANKINNKMDVSSAIKQYADSYIKEEEKSKFIEIALGIYESYQEEAK
jgi:exonuclease SbcD